MKKINGIPLTSSMNVSSGSHISYFYGDPDKYIENAISFIRMGFKLGQYTIYIDNAERTKLVMQALERDLEYTELKQYLHLMDNEEFYRTYEDFHFERILNRLDVILQPYLQNKCDVRLWGHVDWREQLDICSKLHIYECQADLSLSDLGFLTVCAYDGRRVPAYIQTELMRSHEYLLTDQELVLSNLYKRKEQKVIFPSLCSQSEIESEMDLYRQKLDFVHVVSHEVRNPLTVIKAYAKMVGHKLAESNDRSRLQAICDYVDLIDNEIAHIINTEQMMTSEALWRKKLITPKSLLEEVIRMMDIKARTQNIQLESHIQLNGSETIFSNAIGFKLIVSNLMSNAIKYSFEESIVGFRAYCEEGSLILIVEDSGVGMSEEELSKLFRKYEKINEEKGGQGIGLFMVKKLTDHFEGDIQVTSESGKGTKFIVCLPLQSSLSSKEECHVAGIEC